MSTLDSILSGSGDAPAQDQTKDEQNVTQSNAGVAQQEMTHGDGSDTQVGDAQDEGGDRTRMVPHEALHAEKQKVKRYTEQVADFEKKLGGVHEQNAALTRQVTELLQRIPQQRQEQPEPTDFFADPDKAMNERLQAALGQAVGPVQSQLMAQSQMLAGMKYGDDKVQEAEQAFITALQSNKLDPADYQRVVNSPNRYAAAAEWHKRQQAQAEIGDDPAAFKAKLETEIREKLLAEINGGNGQQAQQRPAPGPTPSNLAGARNVGTRTGPAWSGPSDIGSIFAGMKAQQ